MTLMPFVSTWSGRSSAVPVASVMAVLPYWAPLVIHDRFALRPVNRDEGAVADDEHDRALAALAHVADDRAYRPDVAHELQVEARHPLLFGQVLEQPAGRAARAGDQDVDVAEPLDSGVDAALDVLGHAHIAGQRQHRPASIGGD